MSHRSFGRIMQLRFPDESAPRRRARHAHDPDRYGWFTRSRRGVVAEIAERLAALQLDSNSRRRIAVVVPLREDAHTAIRELLAAGPPFDPEALGLDRHQVYLTGSEAIFIFESHFGAKALEPLLESPELWQSAAAWHDHLDGPPRIAEDLSSWQRPTPYTANGASSEL